MAFHLEVPPIIKKHPAIIIGGLGALIVVFLILRANGASAGSSTSSGVAVADPNSVLAAQTQEDVAGLNLQGSNAQIAGQIQTEQDQHAADTALATIQAQVAQLTVTDDNQAQTLQAQLAATLASHTSDNDLTGTEDQDLTSLKTVQSNNDALTTIAQVQTGGQVAIANLTTAGNVSIAQSSADVEKTIAAYQAGTAIQESNNATTLGVVQSNNQLAGLVNTNTTQLGITTANDSTQLGIAQAGYASQTAIGQANDNAQVSIANTNASVAKKQSSNNLLGGIVGAALSFL